MPGTLTLPVAVMQPTPPFLSPSSRKTSEPGNTAKPGKRSISAAVLLQSPELSLKPATGSGYALISRPTSAHASPSTVCRRVEAAERKNAAASGPARAREGAQDRHRPPGEGRCRRPLLPGAKKRRRSGPVAPRPPAASTFPWPPAPARSGFRDRSETHPESGRDDMVAEVADVHDGVVIGVQRHAVLGPQRHPDPGGQHVARRPRAARAEWRPVGRGERDHPAS